MKDISQLSIDLKMFAQDLGRDVARGVVEPLLDKIVAAPDFPRDTGRLRASGYGYVEGEVVAQSKADSYGLEITPPPPIVAKEATASILFLTPKPAKENATIFFLEGGEKKFDYAPYVHEVMERYYVDSYINMDTLAPFISITMDEKWSKTK